MHNHRAGVVPGLLFLLMLAIGTFVVCTNGSDQPNQQLTTSDQDTTLTDSALIERTIKGVMERWNYRDFAALYDMEFEYVQDKYTYDDYLKQPRIKRAVVDTFYDYKVVGLKMFDHDSALVDNVVSFKGPTGKISELRGKDMVYYYKGRWVRPTFGVASLQRQYDEVIRKADSAAAAEEAEDMGN